MTDALFILFCMTAIAGVALINIPAAMIIGGTIGAVLTLTAQRGAKKS